MHYGLGRLVPAWRKPFYYCCRKQSLAEFGVLMLVGWFVGFGFVFFFTESHIMLLAGFFVYINLVKL